MKLQNRVTVRAVAVCLTLVCLASLIGCARTAQPQDEAKQPAITLRVLSVGSSGEKACQRVSKALSEITMRKFGFAVELQQASMSAYDNTLSRDILLGDAPDLFCYMKPEYLLNCVEEGYVAPLDDMLKESEWLNSYVAQELWNCVRVGGQIYAVPANNKVNYSLGFLARADIVRELGIEPSEVTTWDQLHDVLVKVKKAYPDIVPVVPHFGQTLQSLGQDPLGDDLGVLLANQGTKVENLYASSQYAEMCQRMHQWYEEGLILENASLTDDAAPRMMKLCNGFGFFPRLSDNNIMSNTRSYGEELVAFVLGDPIANSSSVNLGWCVASTSRYKQEALRLIELLYIDQEAADLCIYGQENMDYVRLDKNTVTNIETLPADEWSTVHWGWPNRQVASSWTLPGKIIYHLPERGAQRSPAMGFVFDSTPVQPAVNRCKTVTDKYHNALMSGYLDPQDALPRFLEELKEAGIDDVITEKQAQLDIWLEHGT